jgi:hypothetical protein
MLEIAKKNEFPISNKECPMSKLRVLEKASKFQIDKPIGLKKDTIHAKSSTSSSNKDYAILEFPTSRPHRGRSMQNLEVSAQILH